MALIIIFANIVYKKGNISAIVTLAQEEVHNQWQNKLFSCRKKLILIQTTIPVIE
jgi:hypothetical protein